MGEVELDYGTGQLNIVSIFVFYGDAAAADLSVKIGEDIAAAWNEPRAQIRIGSESWLVNFEIEGRYESEINPDLVWYSTNPRMNFFRIEEYAEGNIYYVDGVGSNTGYFKFDNLLNLSTTAAHEYGHTLGLYHPQNLDIRGMGQPGIMYPRGTICDPPFQYDPHAKPLAAGGTLNPALRKVLVSDIQDLKLEKLRFRNNKALLGEFTNLFHAKHALLS